MSGIPIGDNPPPSQSALVKTSVGMVDRGSNPLEAMHNYHKAVFQKITNADRMLARIREEMDKLTNMGDTISPEDVVAAAGRVVGHGVPAREMATLLAGMPTQAGQGLASWIAQQNQAVQQQEVEVARAREVALHHLGVSALRAMAAGDVMNQVRKRSTVMGPLAPGGNQAIASQPASSPAQAFSSPMPTAPAAPVPSSPMMPISGALAPGGQS